jgi:hypothetical protein
LLSLHCRVRTAPNLIRTAALCGFVDLLFAVASEPGAAFLGSHLLRALPFVSIKDEHNLAVSCAALRQHIGLAFGTKKEIAIRLGLEAAPLASDANSHEVQYTRLPGLSGDGRL